MKLKDIRFINNTNIYIVSVALKTEPFAIENEDRKQIKNAVYIFITLATRHCSGGVPQG